MVTERKQKRNRRVQIAGKMSVVINYAKSVDLIVKGKRNTNFERVEFNTGRTLA